MNKGHSAYCCYACLQASTGRSSLHYLGPSRLARSCRFVLSAPGRSPKSCFDRCVLCSAAERPLPSLSTCTVSLRDAMKRLPTGVRTPGNPMCAHLRPAGRRLRRRGPVRQGWQQAASSAAEVCSCCFSGRASQLCHRHGLPLHLSDERHVAGLCDHPRCSVGQQQICRNARVQHCNCLCDMPS